MISKDPFSLAGKYYLVTGASSGIGYEVCRTIDDRGGNFIATARREVELEKLLKECKNLGNKKIVADLLADSDISKLNEGIDSIDGFVHCAGIVALSPAKYYTSDLMETIRKTNYDSAIKILRLLLKGKKLKKGGSIVLVTSISASFGMNGNGIYAGSKGALLAISKVWANELSPLKIRVNCVSPGMVRTEITKKSVEDLSLETILKDEKKYPLGYGEVQQVANPIIFLLSEASNWITGQNLIIDGGRTSII